MKFDVAAVGDDNPRLIVTEAGEGDDVWLGTHRQIEIKVSDDGGVIVDLWDDEAGEFIASRTIDFRDLLDDAGV